MKISMTANTEDIKRIKKKVEMLKSNLITFSALRISISAREFYDRILYYMNKDADRVSGAGGKERQVVGEREGFPIYELSEEWVKTKDRLNYEGRTIGVATGDTLRYFFDERETVEQKMVLVDKKSVRLFAGFNKSLPTTFPSLGWQESADDLAVKIYGMEFGWATGTGKSAPERPSIRPATEWFMTNKLGMFRERMQNAVNKAIIFFGAGF